MLYTIIDHNLNSNIIIIKAIGIAEETTSDANYHK